MAWSAHVGVSIPDHRSDMRARLVASGLIESVQTIVNIFDPLAAGRSGPAVPGSTTSRSSPAASSTRAG